MDQFPDPSQAMNPMGGIIQPTSAAPIRMRGDLMQPLPDDADTAGRQPDQPAPPEQFPGETPEEYQSRLDDQVRDRLNSVEQRIVSLIDQTRYEMDFLREQEEVKKNYDIEEEKYACEQKPDIDAQGRIKKDSPNAHLKAGLTLGLFLDNCIVLPSKIARAMIGKGRSPFRLEPVAKRQENEIKQAMLEDMLLKMIDESNWRGEVSSAAKDLPKHGKCILRQSWVERLGLRQTEPGKWEEVVEYRGMTIKHWPLLNVYIGNTKCKWAWEQDAVLWYSQTTMSELAKNERVFDLDSMDRDDPMTGQPVPVPTMAIRGRYVGLENLRRQLTEERRVAVDGQRTTGMTVDQTVDSLLNRVSAERLFDLYEYQGYFPIGAMMRDGTITPEVLQYFGVEMGGDWEAQCRLADRLMWYITIVTDTGQSGGTLIELKPCPYRRQRTELVAGTFIRDGHKFYGLSSDKIGHDVADAADKALNDIIDIMDNNADPVKIVQQSAVMDDTKAQKMLNQRGGYVTVGGGMNAEQAVQYLLKPYNESFIQMMEKLIQIYTTRTMATQASKGAPAITGTGTATEMQAQDQAAEQRLSDIIYTLNNIEIVVPSIRMALEDLDWFYTPEELEEEAKRVAGERGLEAKQILPTMEDQEGGGLPTPLADEFIVKHVDSATIQDEVALQFILQAINANKDMPEMDRVKMLEDAFALVGLDASPYFEKAKPPMAPRKEFEMILAGDAVKVDPQEDAIGLHLPEHTQQMQWLMQLKQAKLANGERTAALDAQIQGFAEHLRETQDLAHMQLAQMQQQLAMMKAQMQAQPGQPGQPNQPGQQQAKKPPQGGGKSAASGAPPRGPAPAEQIQQGIQSNAMGAPMR